MVLNNSNILKDLWKVKDVTYVDSVRDQINQTTPSSEKIVELTVFEKFSLATPYGNRNKNVGFGQFLYK